MALMRSANGVCLPWTYRSTPHGVLDLLRGCNVKCAGCYNARPASIKPITQVCEELRQMMAIRRLQAVTLLGGEPTLHPQLVEIIEYAVSLRLKVALLTNGVLLTPQLLMRLKRAGLELVYLHIQQGQQRKDLSIDATAEEARALRRQKAALVANHGLQVGFSIIAYQSQLPELKGIIQEVVTSPTTDSLLVTNYVNPDKFSALAGDLATGLSVAAWDGSAAAADDSEEVHSSDVIALMAEQGMAPFAFLGSSSGTRDVRWRIYQVAVMRTASGRVRCLPLVPGISERLLIRLPYWLSGRYVFYHRADMRLFRCRLLLSAFSGGTCLPALRLLAASYRSGAVLQQKFLSFQQGPNPTANGHVVLCRNCPDATVRNGQLVPVCLADKIAK